jgi:hypothetical protein
MEDNSAGRRAADYWFIDGLPESVFGIGIALWSITGLVWKAYVHTSWMAALLIILSVGLFSLFIWPLPIIGSIKSKITYPRTGYVQPPADPAPDANLLISLNLNPLKRLKNENVTLFRSQVVLLMQGAYISFNLHTAWAPAISTAVVALLLALFRRRPYYQFSWASLMVLALLGLMVPLTDPPEAGRGFLASVCSGVWLAAIGLIKLVRYLRAHPHVAEAQEAGA